MKFYIRLIWYFLCKYIFISLDDKSFTEFIRRIQYRRFGFQYYKLNLHSPSTFTEHINILKLGNISNDSLILADKVKVRNHVAKLIGPEYLIPKIGVYNSGDEIVFQELPNKFVLKANHGSGWNIICHDKIKMDWPKAKYQINSWLSRNAYYMYREKQYKSIKPQIICEKLIAFEPTEYKIFSRLGIPYAIQVDDARFSNHRRLLMSPSWENLNIRIIYPPIERRIPKPKNLVLMLDIASKLSEGLNFARIDLYEVEGKVYFGEVTLFPGGGTAPFQSYGEDKKLGEIIFGNS